MFTRIIKLGAASVAFLLSINVSYAQESISIDGFEYDSIPVVRPTHDINQHTRFLWGHSPSDKGGDPRPGRAFVAKDQAYIGNNSMAGYIESTMNTFIQFYPYDDTNLEYRYIREELKILTGVDDWKKDTYNRLKFWVKVDPNQNTAVDQQTNFHFGTYYRRTDGKRNSAESGGNHFYHYYNLEPTGEWHQIIVDFHPSAIRGLKGSIEHGVWEYPTGETGFNYFDLMTRFYVKFTSDLSSYPGTHYFDGFELYNDTNPENIKQIYSLSGVYVPIRKEIIVAWKRDKSEDKLAHEVRYSYSSIHKTGWDIAKTLPNSTVMPKGLAGYNGMKFKTTTDQMENFNDPASVFIGIKPANSTQFREIEVPLKVVIRPKKIVSLKIIDSSINP